jgi:hypothetical protein
MPGSPGPAAVWPRPLKLTLRLLVAAIVVLASLHALERPIIAPMVPLLEKVAPKLDDALTITDARVISEDGSDQLRFRANLTRPLAIAGNTLYPFGSGPMPPGGYETVYSLDAALSYSALLLIVVLAWPARAAVEYAARVLVSLVLGWVLMLLTVSVTVVAELQHAAETLADPHALGGWMILSRLVMGGGGLASSLTLAALAVSAGRWLDDFVARARRSPSAASPAAHTTRAAAARR